MRGSEEKQKKGKKILQSQWRGSRTAAFHSSIVDKRKKGVAQKQT